MARVSLHCPNGHDFTASISKVGGTTQCPDCWRNDRRRVSVAAGKRAFAAALGGAGPAARGVSLGELEAEHARLAEAWAAEAPAAAALADLEGDAAAPCGTCGGPRQWAGAHSVIVCPACRIKDTSPGAKQREAAHAQARASKRKARELPALDRAAERAARIQLHARREQVRGLVAELEQVGDPRAYDHRQDQEQARTIGGAARGYLAEIDRADADELAEIEAELRAALNSPLVIGLTTNAEQARQRRQAAELAARDADEIARRLERQAIATARQPRAIAPAPRNTPADVLTFAMQQAERRIPANACEFPHWRPAAATRLYLVTHFARSAAVRMPPMQRRACTRHWVKCEQWYGERGVTQLQYREIA